MAAPGDVQGIPPAGYFRVDDDVQTMNAVRLFPAQGSADAPGGIVQRAPQLQLGVGPDLPGVVHGVEQSAGGVGQRKRLTPVAGLPGTQGRRRVFDADVEPTDFAAHETFGHCVGGQQALQAAQQCRRKVVFRGVLFGSVVFRGHRSSPFGASPLRAASMDSRTEFGISTPCRAKDSSTWRPMLRGSL